LTKNTWLLQYGKQYAEVKEEALRFVIFKSNLRIINEQNAAFKSGASSFWMAINSLTDLSDHEYRNLLGYKPNPILSSAPNATNCTHQDVIVPASVDWRDAGAVTPVKDQGQCGRSRSKTLHSRDFHINSIDHVLFAQLLDIFSNGRDRGRLVRRHETAPLTERGGDPPVRHR
jgi:hypothetical protein